MADTRQITARSLLLGFLELRSRLPKFADWTEERLAHDLPCLYRLRQLVAMFGAFRLPWDPESFTKGKFIDPRSPRYTALLATLAAEMPQMGRQRFSSDQLPNFFEILFSYRTRVDNVLSFASGVMEASGLYFLAYIKAEELNRVIQDNVSIVEDKLVALISPEGASFPVEQMVRDFAYPDVNLLEIDIDNF